MSLNSMAELDKTFWIHTGLNTISVHTEFLPDHNGSEVVLYAVLPGAVSGDVVGFTKSFNFMKNKIYLILN